MEVNGFFIRPSLPEDRDALKRLWQICFQDPKPYIDRFFSCLYQDGCAQVALNRDGVPVSMAMGLELMALKFSNGQSIPCRYLYAVATTPASRNLGLGRAVSQAAGAGLVLPAEPTLYDYYARQGFQDYFYVQERVLRPGEYQGAASVPPLHPCSAAQYGALRESLLAGRTHLVFEEKALLYQEKLGGLFTLCNGCAAIEQGPAEGQLFVKELLVPEAERENAFRCLAAHFPEKELLVRMPADARNACRAFGQCRKELAVRSPLPPGDIPYFGFAFD